MSKRKKSMIKWIVLNKRMSFSQKTKRFFFWLQIPILRKISLGSVYTVRYHVQEYRFLDLIRLSRNIELLMKKGYKVRLKLWMTEKTLSSIDLEGQDVLIRLLNQSKRQLMMR